MDVHTLKTLLLNVKLDVSSRCRIVCNEQIGSTAVFATGSVMFKRPHALCSCITILQ